MSLLTACISGNHNWLLMSLFNHQMPHSLVTLLVQRPSKVLKAVMCHQLYVSCLFTGMYTSCSFSHQTVRLPVMKQYSLTSLSKGMTPQQWPAGTIKTKLQMRQDKSTHEYFPMRKCCLLHSQKL